MKRFIVTRFLLMATLSLLVGLPVLLAVLLALDVHVSAQTPTVSSLADQIKVLADQIKALSVPPVVVPPVVPPVTPPPVSTGTWPSGWDDPVFVNMRAASLNSYGLSGSISNFQITTTSGDPMIGCANFTARVFRLRGREGVRACAPGNILLEDGYIEATGSGADHADGFQTYGGSGMASLVLRRVNIVVRGSANTGIFLADKASADLTLDHVRVDATGVPNGALFFANATGDKGCNSLTLNDVVAIGGVRFEGLSTCTIKDWTNVRDGNGRAIPRPN